MGQLENEPLEASSVSKELGQTVVVQFEPDDPSDPKNWSRQRRWLMTFVAAILAFNATFASSAPIGIVSNLIEHFRFSQEVVALTISLFIFGYCVGPLFWGPLSEQYGRRPIFLITFPIYTCFQMGCALAPNTASIIVLRLLAGMFAAVPLTNSGALISDIWDAKTRGKALAMFTMATFSGPTIGPLIAGWISQSGTSWRWLFWVLTIFTGICFVAIVFCLPETFAPIILVNKARKLRKSTGDERYYASFEIQQKRTLRGWLDKTVAKPCIMTVQEPMLVATTVYMSFVYGCMYLLFEAYPIVFTQEHGLSAGISGMMYLPVTAGSITGFLGYYYVFHPRYEAAVQRCHPNPVPPEVRLESAKFGAPLFAIGFFWFGWTSYAHISFWAPMFAGVFLGTSAIWIFLALLNYIVDVYLFAAASALAANTIIRSAAGAGFPLFAPPMYERLTPRWASTILGCFALLMVPLPFVLTRYGPHMRAKSRSSPMSRGI